MDEFRCGGCNRLLAKGQWTVLQIKCPRCKHFNLLRTTSSSTEHHRVPNLKGKDDDQKSSIRLDGR